MRDEVFHATCAVFCKRGLLIRGDSGAGKSDLALRLIEAGGKLVADDYVHLHVNGGTLLAETPDTIRGLIEVRGVGVVQMPYDERADIAAIIDCVSREAVERLPEERREAIKGVELPVLALYPFEASAVAKIRTFLQYPRVEKPLS